MKNNNEPKLRYPEFTDAWEKCKLGDVAEFINGKAYKQEELLNEGKYKVVRVGNFNTNEHWYYSNLELENNKYMVAGDLLYLWATDFGPKFWAGEKAIFHYHIWKLELNYKIIDKNYLYVWLETDKEKIKQSTNGTTMVHVTKSTMEKRVLSFPTLPEQQKIGALFRRLDRLITLHKRKWDDVILLKKALLQKMFPENDERLPEIRFPEFSGDWEKCKLGDLGTIEMNKRIFKEQTSTIGEIPFYKIGTFGGKADAFISKELFEEYKSKYPYPNKGDLLISASGSVGKVVEYSGKDEYFQDSNIVWFNHNGKLNNLFLKQFYSHVQWEGLEGSTIKRLYNKTILGTQISFPSLPEQQKIGTFFRRLDRLISHHQQQYEHYQLLKKALLQQMFI
ncbi:restriction endonuclease subunit S [Avibacterium paragallinarum]|uniref:restriction endonuclease subunit S n=1 Tax=Avibacterium paragallinarum TaxID=728 RepID=UPI00397E1964